MSFSISVGGPVEHVLDRLADIVPPADAKQFDLVKDFITKHVTEFPSEHGINVSASGHHYGVNGSLSITIGHLNVPGTTVTGTPPAAPVQ